MGAVPYTEEHIVMSDHQLPSRPTRRWFLQTAAAASAAAALSGVAFGAETKAKAKSANPNPKSGETPGPYKDIRVAFVGVGGRGAGDLADTAKAGCTVAALVDIDAKNLGAAAKKHE